MPSAARHHCTQCEKHYKNRPDLNRHRKNKHAIKTCVPEQETETNWKTPDQNTNPARPKIETKTSEHRQQQEQREQREASYTIPTNATLPLHDRLEIYDAALLLFNMSNFTSVKPEPESQPDLKQEETMME